MFTAQWEAESIKKSYSKVVDAYGCLGILKINLGKKNQGLLLFFLGDYVLNCCINHLKNTWGGQMKQPLL